MIRELTSLVAQRLGLTIGSTVFAEFRPATAPDDCLLVRRTGGVGNYGSPDLETALVQIVARGTAAAEAYDLVERAVEVLHGWDRGGCDLPVVGSGVSWHLGTARLTSGPYGLGQDDRGRCEYIANFACEVQRL